MRTAAQRRRVRVPRRGKSPPDLVDVIDTKFTLTTEEFLRFLRRLLYDITCANVHHDLVAGSEGAITVEGVGKWDQHRFVCKKREAQGLADPSMTSIESPLAPQIFHWS